MALSTSSAALEAVAMRVTQLNPDGSISSGNQYYVTNSFTKIAPSPQIESGDDIVLKNAAGDICVAYKHGDMTTRLNMEIDLCSPDEILEQFLAGGQLLTDISAALVAPSAVSATVSASGGALAAGAYQWGVTTVGRYGETVISTLSTSVTATGAVSSAVVTWTAPASGTVVGYNIYRKSGATPGVLVGSVKAGTTTFTDIGSAPIGGGSPASNSTAGPGTVGYAAPDVYIVGAPNGVSLEVWTKNIVNGNPNGFRRWVYPWVRNLIRDAYTLDNNPVDNIFKGEGYPNPNFGTGPVGDWPAGFGGNKVFLRALESTPPAATNGPVTIP
jgi:hypothetical protein